MSVQPAMPVNVTITAEELEELLAERDAARQLRLERDVLRGELRLVKAERELAEERLRAYRRELFGAKSEARDTGQLGLFNEAEALTATAQPAQEDVPGTKIAAHTRNKRGRKSLVPSCHAKWCVTTCRSPNTSVPTMATRWSRSALRSANNWTCSRNRSVSSSTSASSVPARAAIWASRSRRRCRVSSPVACSPSRRWPGLPRQVPVRHAPVSPSRIAAPLRRRISANTIAASMVRVGQAVQPVINLLRDTLLDSDIIYGDETTLQVLKEPGRRPQRGLATLGAEQGIVQKRYREADGLRIESVDNGRSSERGAAVYSAVALANLNDLDSEAYLRRICSPPTSPVSPN
ncbi:transposase, IS66 family (plasmid) [Cupriavidus taiwanensis LMG 19424]|nr:transposase, IS66 family [Cupriavidus taiwanensis LMG 19424]